MAAKNMATAACCILMSFMLFFAGVSVASAQTTTATMKLTATKDTFKVGDNVTIEVAIEDVTDLYGLQFELAYDASKLELVPSSNQFTADYSHFESDCVSCEAGITSIYSLIRVKTEDNGFSSRIKLAAFTFKAVKTGNATIELRRLKGVSSEKFINQFGRDDLKVISIQGASSLNITVKSDNSGPIPSYNYGNGSGNGKSLIDEIREEPNKKVAARKALDLLKGWNVNDAAIDAQELTKLINELIADMLIVPANEKVEKNGRLYASVDTETIHDIIQTMTSLRTAANEKGLAINAPTFIQVLMENSNESALFIPSKVLEMMTSAGLDLSIKSSGATLVFPIASIYGGKNKDVTIGIKRSVGQSFEHAGGVYRPAALFDFDAHWLMNEEEELISFFPAEVAVTVEYSAEGLDSEKIGFYYFNEETGDWDYIKGKHNRENDTFSAMLSHFSRYAVMELTKNYMDLSGVYPEALRAIDILSAHHILQGQGGNNFSPNKSMTRGEFVKVLSKALNWEVQPYNGVFSDVNEKDWFADYVGTAYQLGVVQGHNSRFHPLDPVTREEMVTMLMRAHSGMKLAEKGSYEKFTDDESISSWAKEAVYAAKSLGLVSGVGANRFAPKKDTVRADMAVLFYKFFKGLEQ